MVDLSVMQYTLTTCCKIVRNSIKRIQLYQNQTEETNCADALYWCDNHLKDRSAHIT